MISFFGGPRGEQGKKGEQGDKGSPLNITARYYTENSISYESNIYSDASGIILYSHYDDTKAENQLSGRIETIDLKNNLNKYINSNSGEINYRDMEWIAVINIVNNKMFVYRPSSLTLAADNSIISVETV